MSSSLASTWFSQHSAEELAPLLLGKVFVYHSPHGKLAGKIVEVEAYHQDDPASHTFGGRSERNRSMFEAGGRLYVYKIYGIHFCLNFVAGQAGTGEGVLIRALEPLEGIEIMQQNRGTPNVRQLCSGPAKLTQALGITREHDGVCLNKEQFELLDAPILPPEQIVQTTRVGITKSAKLPLRFYVKDSPFISRP